jgi:hypothetical protein
MFVNKYIYEALDYLKDILMNFYFNQLIIYFIQKHDD